MQTIFKKHKLKHLRKFVNHVTINSGCKIPCLHTVLHISKLKNELQPNRNRFEMFCYFKECCA